MAWIDPWYPNALASLRSLRGDGGVDPKTGYRLPLISALDTLGILGTIAAPLVNAITRIMADHGAHGAMATRVGADADGDGLLDPSEIVDNLAAASDMVSIQRFVAMSGVDGSPGWIRSPQSKDEFQIERYELLFAATFLGGEDMAYLSQLRDALAKWEAAIQASANAILAHGANLAGPLSTTEAAAFFAPIRALCITLDVLQENPPQDRADRIKEALGGAINDTSKWAGEAAADLAGKAGEIAGNFGEGFLGNASMMTLVVAGIAVWFAFR